MRNANVEIYTHYKIIMRLINSLAHNNNNMTCQNSVTRYNDFVNKYIHEQTIFRTEYKFYEIADI